VGQWLAGWGGDFALNLALIFAKKSLIRCSGTALQDNFLRYMQDPELHGLVFSQRKKPVSPLI